MTTLTVIAIATAKAGMEEALRATQTKLVGETLNEPGCLRYELNQSLDDGRSLVFVESWASEALWRAHMSGAAIQRFAASGANRLIEEFTLYRLTPVAGVTK